MFSNHLSILLGSLLGAGLMLAVVPTQALSPGDTGLEEGSILLDGFVPQVVQAFDPDGFATIEKNSGGQLDAGKIGSEKGYFVVGPKHWQGDPGPLKIAVYFQIAPDAPELHIQLEYVAGEWQSPAAGFFLDGQPIGQVRSNEGEPGHRIWEAHIGPEQLTGRPIHTFSVQNLHDVGHFAISAIKLSAQGIRLLDPVTKEPVTQEQMLAFIDSRLPKLPAKFAQPAGARFFDFGPSESPPWHDFERVTDTDIYSSQRGFGWTREAAGREAVDLDGPDALRRTCGQITKGSESQDATFRVNLPNGNYGLLLISGGPLLGCSDITANGVTFNTALSLALPEYDSSTAFLNLPLQVQVSDGKLTIYFTGSQWRINALLVYPEQAQPLMSRQIRKLLDDYYLPRFTDITPQPEPLTGVSNADRQRGYVVFPIQHPFEHFYPTQAPKPYDIGRPVRITAAQGETTSASFALRALRALGQIEVVPTDLKGPGGSSFPAKNIEVRYVTYDNTKVGHDKYRLSPSLLVRDGPLSVKAGYVQQVWLTIRVPASQSAGSYQGTVQIRIAGEDGDSVVYPVYLRLLPFQAQLPPDRHLGMWFHPGMHHFNSDEYLEDQLRDLADHEVTTPSCLWGPYAPEVTISGDDVQVDFEKADRIIALSRKYGITGPISWDAAGTNIAESEMKGALSGGYAEPFLEAIKRPGFAPKYLKFVQKVVRHAKEANWPELWFKPCDEPSTAVRQEITNLLFGIIKQVPGTLTSMTVDKNNVDKVDKDLDVYVYSSINPDTIRRAKEAGGQLWYYGNAGRLESGWWLERTEARGCYFWVYCWSFGNPFYALDGEFAYEMGVVAPSQEGPIPTIRWESMRAGRNDLGYIYTLQQPIKAATNSGDATKRQAAGEANAELEAILSALPLDVEKLYAGAAPSAAELDRWRNKLIDLILKLQ